MVDDGILVEFVVTTNDKWEGKLASESELEAWVEEQCMEVQGMHRVSAAFEILVGNSFQNN